MSSLFFRSGTPSDVTINIPWKHSVLDVGIASLPGSPSSGDRYVLASGHGTYPNEIAEWSGTAWMYTVPDASWVLYSEADDGLFAFDGSAWVFIGPSPDHNLLTGLQGGTTDEYYHFTSAQHTGLAGGSPIFVGLTTTAGRIVNVSRYTTTQTLDADDHHVTGNTNGGAFAITLIAGVVGTEYRIANTGTSGNNLTIVPDGSELLIGVNSNFMLLDGETLHIVYDATDGWF